MPPPTDGWTTVTKRARARPSKTHHVMPYTSTPSPPATAPLPAIVLAKQVLPAATALKSCPWWAATTLHLRGSYSALVCAGLGAFASPVARYQLAAALRLRDDNLAPGAACVLADPAMTAADAALGAVAGFRVVKTLDEALDAVAGEGVLLFMPHCERFLYEGLLERFWGAALEKVTVFGNCFSSFYGAGEGGEEGWRFMDKVVADGVAVERLCGDAGTSLYHDAFNDLAVTTFEAPQRQPGVQSVWAWRPRVVEGGAGVLD